jgi:hypothetical protein
MKVSVYGGIHSNIETLTFSYSTAQILKPDKGYHPGDLGGYSLFINEVVAFLSEHGIEDIQGHYDETVANNRDYCGCKFEAPIQEDMANESSKWTEKHASVETEDYLIKPPFSISFAAAGKKVQLFHATPSKDNLYWFERRSEKFFREMAEKTDADVMIYGPTHKPYRKDFTVRSSSMPEAWASRKMAIRGRA